MSRQRALDALALKPADKIAWYEHVFHLGVVSHYTGIDPRQHPTEAWVKMLQTFDMDMIGIGQIPTPGEDFYDALGDETARAIRARLDAREKIEGSFSEEGTNWKASTGFITEEDVYTYDPNGNSKFPSVDVLASEHRPRLRVAQQRRQCQLIGDQCLVIPDIYTTLFMWPVVIFDWEQFLLAAGMDEERFDGVMERFFEISKKDIEYWASQDICSILLHDDLCMTSGTFFAPEWYRENIFPRYKELWKPLKDKGIKIIYVCDGKMDIFMNDLRECGIDGINWDYSVDYESIIERYGEKLCLIGGLDVRGLTVNSPEWVCRETRRLMELIKDVSGVFFHVSGGIPNKVPLENAIAYFDTVLENRGG